MVTTAELIAHNRLFALLDDAGRRRILAVATAADYEVGAAVIKEGEFGDAFFLLTTGTVSVRIGGVLAQHEVAQLVPGAFFGEIAALLSEARTATVFCLSSTSLLSFDGQRVQGILKDYPKVREILVKLGLKRSEENLQTQLHADFAVVPSTNVDATAEGAAVLSRSGSMPSDIKSGD